jgi:hypothetical protein
VSDDKGSITYDQDMFSKTAKEIEKADPIGDYGPIGGYSAYSGSGEASHVRPGDLTIAKLENPGVDGLAPDSGGSSFANSHYYDSGFSTADAESLLQGQVRFYDPTSQFNINTYEFWDGDQTYASPSHPAVADFTGSYDGFIDAFYNAQSQMSSELHETAANIRKMATVYKATEDANERDVFGISLPAPYNPPGQ